MINAREVGKLPPSIRLLRNYRTITADRAEIGRIIVDDGQLRIADAAWGDQAEPLPVGVPSGTYPVHVHRWHHRGEAINVCAAVAFRRQLLPKTRQLPIETDIRPDLTEGIIVDSGEIGIRSSNAVRVTSGLGDGCYPVFANLNLGLWLQSLIIDFKIWHARRVILLPGQEMDEYGFVTSSREALQPPVDSRRAYTPSPEASKAIDLLHRRDRIQDLCKLVDFSFQLPPNHGDELCDPADAIEQLDRYRKAPTAASAVAARQAIVRFIRTLPAEQRDMLAWEAGFRERDMNSFLGAPAGDK